MNKADLQITLFNSRRGFTVLLGIGLVMQAMAVQNQARNMVTHAFNKLKVIDQSECTDMNHTIAGW